MIPCSECGTDGLIEVGLDGANNTDGRFIEVLCEHCGGNGVEPCVECGADAAEEDGDGVAYCSDACREAWHEAIREARRDLAADEAMTLRREREDGP